MPRTNGESTTTSWYEWYTWHDWMALVMLVVFLVSLPVLLFWRGRRLKALVTGGLALGLALLIIRWPWQAVVREYHIELPASAPLEQHLTVLQISDVHYSQRWRHTRLVEGCVATALEVAARQRIDLLVFTGDYVAADTEWDPHAILEALSRLTQIRTTYGSYAVLGNHDHWENDRLGAAQGREGREPFEGVEGMEPLGRVLFNEAEQLGDTDLWVVGVDDWSSGRDDVRQAFSGVPDQAFTIVLSHAPDPLREVAVHGGDLMLCGHLHGGQFWIPGKRGWVYSDSRMSPEMRDLTIRGLSSYRRPDGGRLHLLSNAGIGDYRGLRLGCPAEVCLITLSKQPRPADGGAIVPSGADPISLGWLGSLQRRLPEEPPAEAEAPEAEQERPEDAATHEAANDEAPR